MARLVIAVFGLLAACMASAADVQVLSKAQADLFARLYRVFPNGELQDPGQEAIRNPTPWEIRIWATNVADECTYDNRSPDCKGFVLYFSVAEEEIGGRVFAFRTRNAYRWSVLDIEHRQKRGDSVGCALVTLRERTVSQSADKAWGHKDLKLCVSPKGFASAK